MAAREGRRGRVLAMQALYEADTSRHLAEEALDRAMAEHPEPEPAAGLARRLVRGVLAHQEVIDGVIAEVAPRFPIDELAVVDRNILRIAIYEMRFGDETPVRVAINEAVELAKTYGGESSPRFVNGALGAVASRSTQL